MALFDPKQKPWDYSSQSPFEQATNPWNSQAPPAPAQAPYTVNGPMTGSQPDWAGFNPNVNTGDASGLIHHYDENGNEFGPADLGGIQLGQMPTIPGQFSPEFLNNYNDYAAGVGNAVAMPWDYNVDPMRAAQINMGDVSTPSAQQYGTSSELNRLLSGQGYDPATLARMHATASDTVNRQGVGQMSQAKRALEQAGYQDSPAAAAIQADVARQSGAANTEANNQIEINNATTGVENLRQGVGMQTNIGLSNMQQANQMALANASRLFEALSQNTANQQQANAGTFNANTQRQQGRAQATSGAVNALGQGFAGAQLQKQANSDVQNAQNAFNWNLNQAQLDRQQGMQNQNTQENRWNRAYGETAGYNPMSG